MKKESSIVNLRLPVERRDAAHGFTLIEVMVVVVLLSLIVLALMAVFNTTQQAFRASITQTDVLEGGRAAMDLMVEDAREMSPSFGQSNNLTGAVNFYANVTAYPPVIQSLIPTGSRTNVLENFFVLSRGNANGVPTWYGVGYAVTTNSPTGSLYSLYRFATNHPVASVDPAFLFTNDFIQFLFGITNGSHLLDGVVDLTVRPFDNNGQWMTNNYLSTTNKNVFYFAPQSGEVGFAMFSNTLPASVEIEIGVLEDRTLQRAESLSGNSLAQSNYLAGAAAQVHIFRQRVTVPNLDLSAYQ